MINKCRSCYSPKLTKVLNLGNQYLSDFIEPGAPKPAKYPLELALCKECTLLQLKHTTPPQELYTDRYGYKSGVNENIREDLEDIVEKAVEKVGGLTYKDKDAVVDIGCNDLTLLKNYQYPLNRIGFDPVDKWAKDAAKEGITFINNYFSAELYPKNLPKAKIVTAISMFYDLDDPNKFVKDVRSILADDGVFIVQQNYLLGMLKQLAFDNVVHEHLEYYSLTSLEHLLNRHYLKVIDVEYNSINGGSFRAYIKHMSPLEKMRLEEKGWKLDKTGTYFIWGMRVNLVRKKLYNFIKKQAEQGKTVYCYAASTRGSTLLQSCGLDSTLIKAAVERNPEKWSKVMASTGIPIISEEQARKDNPDFYLVLPWFFVDGFIEREKEYLKGGGRFIVPLPKFRIIGGDDI